MLNYMYILQSYLSKPEIDNRIFEFCKNHFENNNSNVQYVEPSHVFFTVLEITEENPEENPISFNENIFFNKLPSHFLQNNPEYKYFEKANEYNIWIKNFPKILKHRNGKGYGYNWFVFTNSKNGQKKCFEKALLGQESNEQTLQNPYSK